tara:strand:- start:363 stop:1148 length:786 start_codon:yes stop_codon:yes gene_type:complete
MNSSLYSTIIMHERFRDLKHKFKYYILSIFIDQDELIELTKKISIFSYNKFNIFSYYEKDHGYRDGRLLREFVEDFLSLHKIRFKRLKINIMCLPRIFGYVFNPLSIIYCYEDEKLIAIFYEVKNTSNEQHTYCFVNKNNENINININEYNHECNKNFYVSPFIGMKARYKFKNLLPQKKMSIVIDLFDKDNKKILTATQYGFKLSFDTFSLLKQLLFNPLVTIKVIFAILYESIFIILKGGKYYAREKKINDSISFEGDL